MQSTVLPLPPGEQVKAARRLHRSSARQQAVELQRLLSAQSKSCVKPLEIAAVARAWCDVNEEVRKLAMRPLPRPVDVSKVPRRRSGSRSSPAAASAPGPVEPAAAPAVVEVPKAAA